MTEQVQKKTISASQRNYIPAISAFLVRNEFLIPLTLFLVFLAFTLPGIPHWGMWHPDEIVVRSIKALHGEWQFSETNFDYPDLPQWTMYWLGKVIIALGHNDDAVLPAARMLSAVLAGLTIILTYAIARRAGGNVTVAGLSALFLLCVSELSHNGRFAHNDTYVLFFTTLSILMLLQYHGLQHRGWLYAAFLFVGMAASSKYTGGSLVIAPVVYYLVSQRKNFRSDLFSVLETLFVGGAITFLGYAIGTPKALFWMTWYFKRVFIALQWQIQYGRTPDSVRGIFGQYAVLYHGLGLILFLLFLAAFLWTCSRVVQALRQRTFQQDEKARTFSVLLLALLALDLPVMVSYNYLIRYLLGILPILAVFSGFFVEWLYRHAAQKEKSLYSSAVVAGVVLIALFSLARLTSVALLFIHDARTPAGTFISQLPAGTSLEHTSYPPDIPERHFEREHNYPIYFVRNMTDKVPENKKMPLNIGEAGLDERQTTYLVTDNFTTDKFNDPYTCSLMQVECDFFRQLAAGGSDHYKLIAEFSYHLPKFLPQLSVDYVNPAIRVYERMP